ncbi:1-acyl-sn-glycerol-3-phosphate acyltransferase [Anaerofilum sp. BX8]|uniref:1-acyl-sn-glycerol-3-phosphate acyltransferase n=1 Tax=Anaerofilum hominis TaxID=2763016 RepID=A0A923I7Q4_9FIRM|nr:lysophospholipid acyltransferase family protein [Anaerofilum hominis]MBC5580331.1 1-acyl-sn-glycerol-3-phosphate acyltransferase [Anaerofilum hominis]
MFWFYHLCFILASVVFRLPYRIRVIGRENLPRDRGYVLCPNHLSAIDPVFVVLARGFGKPMWVMAKEELFRNGFVAWFFRHVGVFPVERGKGDKTVLNNAIESVRNGRSMLIFPEGTRNKKGEGLLPLKSGAFVVAESAHADIVPCRVLYKGGRQHLFCTVTVVFGAPIPIDSLNLGGEHAASKLRAAKAVLAARLGELYEQNKQYE